MTTPHTIDDALTDPALLGAALGDITTWRTWRIVFKAAFGTRTQSRRGSGFRQRRWQPRATNQTCA